MTEEGYYAVCCEDEDCLNSARVQGGREEAIRAAQQGCPQCFGEARPYFFEPMGKPVGNLEAKE